MHGRMLSVYEDSTVYTISRDAFECTFPDTRRFVVVRTYKTIIEKKNGRKYWEIERIPRNKKTLGF